MAEWLFARGQTGRGEEWGETRWRIWGNFSRSQKWTWKICGYLSVFPPYSHQRLHMLVHSHWSAADQLRHTHRLHICGLPAHQGAVCGSRYHARGGGVRSLPCVGAAELLFPSQHQTSSPLYPLPARVCRKAAETIPLLYEGGPKTMSVWAEGGFTWISRRGGEEGEFEPIWSCEHLW